MNILMCFFAGFAMFPTDCLEAVRELKQLGIGIIFEREGINTLSIDSELLLTILSSIAETELVNLSENIRWRKKKDFSEGKVHIVKSYFNYLTISIK